MHNRFLSTILLFSMPLFYMDTAYSDVYKWIGDDGKVVYGDKPATHNADKIKIKQAPELDQHSLERHKKQQKLLDILQEERDEKIALIKEEKEKKAKQKRTCAEIIKELQETKDASFLYKKTDDPDNPKVISDAERKAEEEKYEQYIKENC